MHKSKNNEIAIIQPLIRSYRAEFYSLLSEQIKFELFTINKTQKNNNEVSKLANVKYIQLKTYQHKQFRWFNPLPILHKYKTIVLCGESSIISNWLILLFSKMFKTKVYVWGHGVTYSKTNPINIFHSFMYCLSDGAVFYTTKEMRFWKQKFSSKKMTTLNNTLYIDQSYYNKLNQDTEANRCLLKRKYGITQKKVFISCHRFTNPNRRHDLLEKVISESDSNKTAFIIIGEGKLKPDFSIFSNVFDFGAVWDNDIKTELFFIADFYLQFGWTGLSIVEAFAHAKPVITMQRSKQVKHSVEYFYLKDNYNSIILNDVNHFHKVLNLNETKIQALALNALNTYNNQLHINQMVNNMYLILSNEE